MKKYTEKELAEMAKGYFNQNPSVKQFFATQDGMFFTNENLAKNHNSTVVKGEVLEIGKKTEAPEAPEKVAKDVKEFSKSKNAKK